MQSQSQSSYHEDILKVKKIWNDINEVDKSVKKTQNNVKAKNSEGSKKKQSDKQKSSTNQSHLKKNKSQLILKPNERINQVQEIIQFSTVSPKHSNFKSIPSPTSNYIQSYNMRLFLQQKDIQLSLLRTSNQQLKDKLQYLQSKLRQKDLLISKLQSRQHQLLGETSKFQKQKLSSLTQSVEYMNQKNDSIRLLKMLKSTKEYKDFAQLALQDNGVRCLHLVNKQKKKSKIDIMDSKSQKKSNIHFCSCNAEFLPEDYLWVPSDAYEMAKQFVRQKKNQQVGEAQIQLLLYDLNKIWREREKKLINRLNSGKALEVGKYKRRILDIEKNIENGIQIEQ